MKVQRFFFLENEIKFAQRALSVVQGAECFGVKKLHNYSPCMMWACVLKHFAKRFN